MTYIYEKIQQSDFHDAFRRMNRLENFSYEGRRALFEYLENLANDTGEPMELDVIALCCDFSEYGSLELFNKEYGKLYTSWDAVQDETTVIPVGDGAIVQAF